MGLLRFLRTTQDAVLLTSICGRIGAFTRVHGLIENYRIESLLGIERGRPIVTGE